MCRHRLKRFDSSLAHKRGKVEITIKEYVERIVDDLEKRIEQARVTMEKRLDSMNEFRDALKDQSAKSPTREEMSSELDSIRKDVKSLISFKDSLEGKASQEDVNKANRNAFIGIAIGFIGLLMGILRFFIE